MILEISILIFSIGLISIGHLYLYATYYRKPNRLETQLKELQSKIVEMDSRIEKISLQKLRG